MIQQTLLAQKQLAPFYHSDFVKSQIQNYRIMTPEYIDKPYTAIDVGGGFGYFAETLRATENVKVRVIDSDPVSIAACREKGLDARLGDALKPQLTGDEDVVCFNLILHHLVSNTASGTTKMQKAALLAWKENAKLIFVDEYIYDSYLGDMSGWLIYFITSSRHLSAVARAISRYITSLSANTFFVGVRFRSRNSWLKLFESIGYNTLVEIRGSEETVSLARRLLLIKSCRRDAFLLKRNTSAS